MRIAVFGASGKVGREVVKQARTLGWGVVGRIAEGTTVTFTRRPTDDGKWFPARARIEARGRTLLFRSFDLDTTTEWYGYRPVAAATR